MAEKIKIEQFMHGLKSQNALTSAGLSITILKLIFKLMLDPFFELLNIPAEVPAL